MASRLLPALLAMTLAAAACGDSRPAGGEWQPEWERVVQSIPTQAAFVGGPDEDLCADALVIVRDANDVLLPTPDTALDGAVEAWLAQAREMFLECPPRGAADGFADGYARLEALRAEVEAGLTRTG